MSNDNKTSKLTMKEIILKGSIIAVIVTVPSITTFAISWFILDNLMQAAIIGGVIHFIAMGFSLKISKKLLVKRESK
ncbi:hypothetical protein [Nitrosarchaeum koreense]|uniref:Uncharacterized protein n=1 Tax=Nitrosarchaeum koreense MY1 TaxID=1001994 RepID=F9CU93_9ARCH|nr:hypothetical protein [Nitrosarchaeum koreense]EGP94294.1 hypothetical protein MY1_1540 [Nitrosarchaeum koreense MY1]